MSNIKFTQEHEWLSLDNNVLTVGVTDYAQDHLGDVVYVQLPELNRVYKSGEEAAVIESVKTAGGIAMPFTGKIVAINETLNDDPATVNRDPLGAGWFFKMIADDIKAFDALMDQAAYEDYIANLA